MLLAGFWVDGEPKAQPRPKAARIGGFIRIYTPATAKKWKEAVVKAAAPHVTKGAPITGALKVALRFFFERPQSHLKKSGGLTKSAPRQHTGRPDVDNLAKAVLDALTDAGLWKDDSQIVSIEIEKLYSATKQGCSVCIADHPTQSEEPNESSL